MVGVVGVTTVFVTSVLVTFVRTRVVRGMGRYSTHATDYIPPTRIS